MNENITQINKRKYSVLDAFKFFFFLVITIFAVSIIFDIVLGIVCSVKDIEREVLNNNEFVQIISYIINPIVFIIYFFVYNLIHKVDNKFAFNDGQKISLLPISVSIVLAIIAIFLFTPFMKLIEYWFMNMGYNPDDTIPLQDKMSSSFKFFMLGLLIYALLPAIAEEIVFRGVIQKSIMSKYNGFVAICVSTLLFVLMHGALQQTVYQLIMGIMLGYVACVGGSILYSIILHFLNNAFVLLFGCFNIVSYLSEDVYYINVYSIIFPICIFLLGIILVGILFWVLKYLRNKNFFRIEKKKKKSKVQTEEVKFGIKDFWKNLEYKDKVFAIASVTLIGIVWLVNTISQFIVS